MAKGQRFALPSPPQVVAACSGFIAAACRADPRPLVAVYRVRDATASVAGGCGGGDADGCGAAPPPAVLPALVIDAHGGACPTALA